MKKEKVKRTILPRHILRGTWVLALLLCTHLALFAQADKMIIIRKSDVPIREALELIQKEADTHFVYDEQTVSPHIRVTLDYPSPTKLPEVLDDLCEQASLRYEIKRNLILLLPAHKDTKQEESFMLNGTVTDENGESLIGVNVKVGGSKAGTVTDMDGHYALRVKPGDLLTFTYIGMNDQAVKIKGNRRTINVVMESNDAALSEVVVTGYQTLSKERATGSYTVLNAESTKGKLETNILSRIEGLVAGINRTGNSDEAIVIRGITSINEATTPLYVVDGMPYEGELASINPSDVENITVLKDAAASSIYGARAANGVIVITTKRGQEGKTRISYNGSIKFTPKPDLDYLNLMSSSELVDTQIEGFNYYHADYENLNQRQALNPVVSLLYQHERGNLTDQQLEQALLPYRTQDNRKQIEDEFARTGLTHQHNLSLSGGSQKNRYIVSVNYTGTYPNQKHQSSSRLGFNLKDDMEFFDWMSAYIGVQGSFTKTQGDTGAESSYSTLMQNYPSYYMLRDGQGNPLNWQRGKSEYELERLQSIGLMDEHYNPIENRPLENYDNSSNYYRIFAGINFKIIEGLTLDLKYQTESTSSKNRYLYDAQSYTVRNMVNDAAQYDQATQTLTLNIPKGGQLSETRGDTYSYTLRAQLNFNRLFNGKHNVTALAGAERRLVRSSSTTALYLGYDDNSLAYSPFNPLILTPLSGTEALNGYFTWYYTSNNYLLADEDRYVSFYANGSYTFDEKYSLTASMRIDQSNLFGTDPKYQYRPLWSVGAGWQLGHEEFMKDISWLNRLNLRLTYGIAGNVPKNAGPYLSITNTGYNDWVGGIGSSISNPPNDQLRWEKTSSVNVGVDFALFNSRLSGSIDFYNKRTTDLLGNRNADPTLGWTTLMQNYGKMNNRGVEIALQSVNIRNKDFTWGTNFMFGYNKNKLLNLEGTQESVFYYTAYDVDAIGYPVNSLFSYRYAGLSHEDGSALVYDKDGNKVAQVSSVDELVYSGTRTPKYTASLKNSFRYKDFDLSFMFVYYGGHVMRDVTQTYMSGAPTANLNRINLNHWRQPGDENIPGVGPAFNRNIYYTQAQAWYAANVHVKRADYIKLRDISLSYNLPSRWLRRFAISSAAITCQVSDAWWWAANGDIDPEAYAVSGYGWGSLTLPNPTTYTIGLSINL